MARGCVCNLTVYISKVDDGLLKGIQICNRAACILLSCLTFFVVVFKIISLCEHACMSEGACRGQKKESESLRLELQVVVSCHVPVGN